MRDCCFDDPLARVVVLEGLSQQVTDEEHLDAAVSQRVVEQQVGSVGRRQARELEIGPVQKHALEHPDLRIYVKGVHVPVARRLVTTGADMVPPPGLQ